MEDALYYYGWCPEHDWEGYDQRTRQAAEADLREHRLLFPDESHEGSEVLTRQTE